MVVVKCQLVLVVVTLLWTFIRGDTEVSCVFMKNCMLPCSFQVGNDIVVHWIQTAGQLNVHSYYYNKDQLQNQNQLFRGRTSLFKDQIAIGNASLQLTGLQVQDKGRYKCYTSTDKGNKESFINLNVNAPVNMVHIEQVENRINCSAEGIYPEPQLTWSTNPPSNIAFNNTPTVQQTEQLLYNISSSLILSDDVTDVMYSCTVSTHSNSRATTLLKPTSITWSNTETISCAASQTPLTSVIWTFNHSRVIVTFTDPNDYKVSEEWRTYVKDVSDTGSLTLQGLSSDQNGVYTCEVSNAEKTFITNTFLEFREGTSNKGIIVGVVVTAVITVVALVLVGLYLAKEKTKKKSKRTNTTKETEQGADLRLASLLNSS